MSEHLVAPRWGYASITDKISDIVLHRPTRWLWALGFGIAGTLALVFFGAVGWLFAVGVGIWGVNIPVAWGFAIANFVWWIGIGHAGTFISAFLLLLRQKWRNSINRFAEAMTLFAAGIAGLWPILHLGRPWFAYWLVPYPDAMNVWPQWRSPLVWDLFAISTYLIVSLLFWYMGLIPDLATLRDRAKSRAKQTIYGLLALGWRGEARHWARYESAYLLFAGLAAPLVISVHSVVSLDFAVANVPGYHSTIFPPFFVAGALFSGFAMVLTLAIPMRRFFRLEDFITVKHLDHAAKLMLATELIVAYSYFMEIFVPYWSGDAREIATVMHRMTGPYAVLYWTAVTLNILMPQLLWFRRVRRSVGTLFAISLLANVGMWVERFDIVVSPLAQSFLSSASGIFIPTAWDWTMFVSSVGLFALFFLLFLRVLPAISIFEMRELAHEEGRAP